MNNENKLTLDETPQTIMKRLFAVAGILVRGHITSDAGAIRIENCPQNHDAAGLQYCESGSSPNGIE